MSCARGTSSSGNQIDCRRCSPSSSFWLAVGISSCYCYAILNESLAKLWAKIAQSFDLAVSVNINCDDDDDGNNYIIRVSCRRSRCCCIRSVVGAPISSPLLLCTQNPEARMQKYGRSRAVSSPANWPASQLAMKTKHCGCSILM